MANGFMDYPKYHQMGMQTGALAERSRQTREDREREFGMQRLQEMGQVQDMQSQQQKMSIEKTKDAARRMVSVLPTLKDEEVEPFLTLMREQHPEVLRMNPNAYDAPTDKDERKTWVEQSVSGAARYAGMDDPYVDEAKKVSHEIQRLIEYRDSPGLSMTDREAVQRMIDNRTAAKDPTGRTAAERKTEGLKAALPRIQSIADEDPNRAYGMGYRMNDDGSVYTDIVSGAPEKLRPADKVLGKRGQVKAIMAAGEQANDAKQVISAISDPEVMTGLRAAENAGMWDTASGAWSNKVRGWLQRNGYAMKGKTAQAIIRMQRYASAERKKFLGTAVTRSELKTIRGWMPSDGDTFDLMVEKMNIASSESDEVFKRFLDVYKNQADMSSFYDAFGIKRFNGAADTKAVDDIKSKYGLQ